MIYTFKCPKCNKRYEPVQSVSDEHRYICSKCNVECQRVFESPIVKRNEGFYSQQLGKYVNSHTQLCEEFDRLRYIHDLCDNLGDNRTPKDEWREQKAKKDQKNIDDVKRHLEATEEQYAKVLEGK